MRAFKIVFGPIPPDARLAALIVDEHRCAACGLGPHKGIELGVGAYTDEPDKLRAFCWACLLGSGATAVQLRYQLPREALRKKFNKPIPEDRVLQALSVGPMSKRDLQRKTHLKLDELEAVLSSLIHRRVVEVGGNHSNRRSVLVRLSQRKIDTVTG